MEPFKNKFGPPLIDQLAQHLGRATTRFDADVFRERASAGLEKLELKQRSEQISRAIEDAMSGGYRDTVAALLAVLHPQDDVPDGAERGDSLGISGFGIMPLTSYVSRNGLDDPDFSLSALEQMTSRFSSEFDVRPFFIAHPELTLKTALRWSESDNYHIRRLASEGSRPLLPWGIRLQSFVDDPSPILPILENLRDDPEDYVRRSVANNLNDIAKNQPDLVVKIAEDWSANADKNRQRLVKHACRTLIKAGHPGALAVFGFTTPDLAECDLKISSPTVRLGDELTLTLTVTAKSGPQNMLIDYVLHFMRANGQLSPKVFKWTETTLKPGETRVFRKTHSYRKVTTRKDYPGRQKLSVQINGVSVAELPFDLKV